MTTLKQKDKLMTPETAQLHADVGLACLRFNHELASKYPEQIVRITCVLSSLQAGDHMVSMCSTTQDLEHIEMQLRVAHGSLERISHEVAHHGDGEPS